MGGILLGVGAGGAVHLEIVEVEGRSTRGVEAEGGDGVDGRGQGNTRVGLSVQGQGELIGASGKIHADIVGLAVLQGRDECAASVIDT